MKPGTIFVFPDDIMLSLFFASLEEEKRESLQLIPNDLTPARRV